MNLWRAGCSEMGTSGSEGGSRKRTGRKAGTAPRSDPYSKLKGPAKWTWFYLYVILDVFSPLHRRLDRAVPRERAARDGADRAGDRAAADHPEDPHAARRSRRADARQAASRSCSPISASRRRTAGPYTSSDNPYSESNFKTLKYRPEFPARFDDIEHAREHCRTFVDWYNHAHRHSGIGLMTPAAVHHGHARAAARRPRRRARRRLRPQPRAVRPQAARPARAADRRVDQQAGRHEGAPLTKFDTRSVSPGLTGSGRWLWSGSRRL